MDVSVSEDGGSSDIPTTFDPFLHSVAGASHVDKNLIVVGKLVSKHGRLRLVSDQAFDIAELLSRYDDKCDAGVSIPVPWAGKVINDF